MLIEMAKDELEMVEALIRDRVEELGPEIRRTDTQDYRSDLKHLREQLITLKHKLMISCEAWVTDVSQDVTFPSQSCSSVLN